MPLLSSMDERLRFPALLVGVDRAGNDEPEHGHESDGQNDEANTHGESMREPVDE